MHGYCNFQLALPVNIHVTFVANVWRENTIWPCTAYMLHKTKRKYLSVWNLENTLPFNCGNYSKIGRSKGFLMCLIRDWVSELFVHYRDLKYQACHARFVLHKLCSWYSLRSTCTYYLVTTDRIIQILLSLTSLPCPDSSDFDAFSMVGRRC